MTDEIRIYVADLAAYNNGKLHGVWIDALRDPSDIQEEINAMLANSPKPFSEEYAIHDFEGFEGYSLSEYDGIETAHTVACFIDEHGKLGAQLLEYFGSDLDEAKLAMEERYCGCFSSLADYAQHLTEETSEVPDHLTSFIDYHRMGRDMDLAGDILSIETAYDEVHIFYAN